MFHVVGEVIMGVIIFRFSWGCGLNFMVGVVISYYGRLELDNEI